VPSVGVKVVYLGLKRVAAKAQKRVLPRVGQLVDYWDFDEADLWDER
jgi:hypothetical protein